ncbi:cell surface glycoprotein MUC18 isoform X4 [Alligator sinensis]|uniref:Cell surface glycoprotein MUC18 isoform X4 n=1 Tax=Alligator sinensis TaxID=38654 RepID=A0A3Q0G8J0_ALLSI|nr:cell surface glycoprotein MUC18 isoform X4 [Alligator sinensis]
MPRGTPTWRAESLVLKGLPPQGPALLEQLGSSLQEQDAGGSHARSGTFLEPQQQVRLGSIAPCSRDPALPGALRICRTSRFRHYHIKEKEIISGARSLECAIVLHRRPAEQTCQRGHGNPGNPDTGYASKVEVSTPSVVEVDLGHTAMLPCSFFILPDSNITYVYWSYIPRSSRTKVYSWVQGKVFVDDSPYVGRVSMDDTFTLAITQTTLQDARVFVCQVGAGSLGVGENRTELRVYKAPEPPEIHANEAGISVGTRESQEIAECVVRNSFPGPNITWLKDGHRLHPEDDKVKIMDTRTQEASGLFTARSRLLAHVPRQDRHAYFQCQAHYLLAGGDRQAQSPKVQVHIFYPTENVSLAIDAPRPQVKEGDHVALRCQGDGNPPPEYSFFRVQNNTATGEEEEQELSGKADKGVLSLGKVHKENTGHYRCKGLDLDTMETLTADAELVVNYIEGLKVTKESPEPVLEGHNLTLTCEARGSRPLAFHWHKDKKGKALGSGQQLQLSNIMREAAGNYICEVTMPGVQGLSRNKQVLVVVYGKPQVSVEKPGVPVQENELVTLTCTALAQPEPSITWSANGTVQNRTENYSVVSNLTVQVTSKLMRSGINCTATNYLGVVTHHVHLERRMTPTTPTTTAPAGNATAEQKPQESKGVIIVAVIVCILVLAVLGAVLYFLHKKGKIPCGRTGKQDITKPDARKDEVVVEVKSDKLPEEAGLLQATNGDQKPAGDQGEKYIDLRH